MSSSRLTLIRARWVAPMDRPLIRDGAVVVRDDRIEDAGRATELSKTYRDAEHIDLGDTVVLPGLINAHVHLELSDVPRIEERWDAPLAEWLIEVIKNAPSPRDGTRVARSIEIGAAQCFRYGITTVGDITRRPELSRPALRRLPLRGISFGEFQAMAQRRHLFDERFAAATDRTHESERLRVGASPHAPYSVEPDGYRRAVASGLPLVTHLAESPDEATFLAAHDGPFRALWEFLGAWDDRVPRFAGGPIRFAKSLGLLDIPSVLAHVNYCDDDELKLLAAGKSSVVYCPRTHAYFGHPLHRWREMLAAGVNVAVGTDSLASSLDLNLVDDLRLLRKLAPDVPAHELWQLATISGARALAMQQTVGTLTPGTAADFACFFAHGDNPLEALLREPVLPTAVWIAGRPITG